MLNVGNISCNKYLLERRVKVPADLLGNATHFKLAYLIDVEFPVKISVFKNKKNVQLISVSFTP